MGSSLSDRAREWLGQVAGKVRQGAGSRLGKALVTTSAGAAAVQVIGIVAAPLTARLFSPSAFGVAAPVTNLIAICATVACLRYEQAIPIPREEQGRLRLAALSLAVVPIVVGLLMIVLLGFGDKIVQLLGEPLIYPFLPLIPVGVALTAAYQVLFQWHVREQEFRRLVDARFAQSLGQIGFQLSLGLLFLGGVWILIWGYLVGYALAVLSFLRGDARLLMRIRRSTNWIQLKAQAHEFRQFPIYNGSSALLDTMTPAIPLFAMVSMFGAEQAGYFRMAQTLVLLPIAAISSSVRSVYWSEASRLAADNPRQLQQLYSKVTVKLVAIGILLIGGSFSLPILVPIVLSDKWTQSGHYAIVVAFPAAAGLVSSAAVNLSLLRRNNWESAWVACRLTSLVSAVAACRALALPPQETLMTLSATMVLGYVALVRLNFVAVRRHAAISIA